jgi:DNA polymerase elongation subunit (family B)
MSSQSISSRKSSAGSRKKFKIVSKPKPDEKQFRLFDFQSYDKNKQFRIQIFGINEQGETCAIFIDDFQPFFYVKLPDGWSINHMYEWFDSIKRLCTYSQKDCLYCSFETRSQLYDFTANTDFNFAKCVFRNMSAFYQFRKHIPEGTINLPTYESKIPPLLRYFHIQNVSPSGWISIRNHEDHFIEEKTTTCDYEYECGQQVIKPLPEKETPVPYKICSFDIEASSSHGDFPVPIKDYKRVATQFMDALSIKMSKQKMEKESLDLWLKKGIMGIYSFGKIENVEQVFPKDPVNKDLLKDLIKMFLTETLEEHVKKDDKSNILKVSDMFEKLHEKNKYVGGGGGDEGGEEGTRDTEPIFVEKEIYKKPLLQKIKNNHKKITISSYLLDTGNTREEKINLLNTIMTTIFPPLEGDSVTFIGSTFLKYGDKEPYRNHCIVVGSCDNVPGTEIVSVNKEEECLLEWTYLIQEENPDIVIGYNIFGFDYQFMFHRAKELDMVDDFCQFSRIQDEMCYKYDRETQDVRLDHTQNRLASGDYDLHYPPMSGRLQIDLLFYFRRDYNLSSYKLDDVAGTMIRDDIKGIVYCEDSNTTQLYSKNLSGLHEGDFIHLEISSFTTDYYMSGKKFKIIRIDVEQNIKDHHTISDGTYNVIIIEGNHTELDPQKKNVKWGMAKDDVSPQDIFRLSKESSASRAIVAKYCVQDCNLVHHLMNKVDVLTGYIEMARICNIPISFLVFRGQGIKLTSYVAKVCREKSTLMPDLEKTYNDDGYEGAIVLPPKCDMYGDNPVACNDYSSLYPSIAKAWNLSPNSKVWTKNYDLDGNLIKINDKKVTDKNLAALEQEAIKYDNVPDHQYIEVEFDSFENIQTYTSQGKPGKKTKVKSGRKVCRWAQFPNGQEGIIPCIIGDLLKARKETRVKAESEPDPFIANVLDKRQLGYKVTANSLYGQMGSSVSTFFEKDVAASITSIGRLMITYAKRMVEEVYGNSIYESKDGRQIRTRSQYVYGDTDSVFFTFNLEDPKTGRPIRGREALEWTIEIAQEAAYLCSLFLPPPMKLAYEKTLMSFILLSKKRYVGMLYELNPDKGKLKFMGLPLKRRDACDYLKDVYGGSLTILMKEPDNIEKAIDFLNTSLQSLVNGDVSMDKLALTKSLRSDYKNPDQIAHKVLANRVGEREPGNKPKPGDRIKYAFIENKNGKLLGHRIETPQYIIDNDLKLDYHYYITNQLMNPLQQLYSLAIEKIYIHQGKKQKDIGQLHKILETMYKDCNEDLEIYMKKREKYCSAEVKKTLFDPFLTKLYNAQNGIQTLTQFYSKK